MDADTVAEAALSTQPATQQTPLRVLVVDDDRQVRESLRRLLESQGHTVATAENEQEAMESFLKDGADVALVDVVFPQGEYTGFRLIRRLRKVRSEIPVIVMTGNEKVAYAREALALDVFDFLNKPATAQSVLFRLGKAARFLALEKEVEQTRQEATTLRRVVGKEPDLDTLFGQSAAMTRIRRQVERLSLSGDVTVLITGQSGTGKEVMARTIHQMSPRADQPFVAVNCAGIPETLFESEFFGYVEGAFTDARQAKKGYFELAHRGTLFLDEVGELPPGHQAKILRVLEERRVRRVGAEADVPVDVRIISATNRPLQEMVAAKTFRDDLYYRLAVMEMHLPPLRERPQDIVSLAEHFLEGFRASRGLGRAVFSPGAMETLLAYPFPGNIRELRNLMERVALLMEGSAVEEEDLCLPGGRVEKTSLAGEDLNLDNAQVALVREAMQRTGGNQTQAAKLLGIGHDALRYKLKKWDI